MRLLQKILLPVDFSERSACAGHYAKGLATRFGAQILLLHVLTPPQFEFGPLEIGGSMLADLYSARNQQAAEDLKSYLGDELAGLDVRRTVLDGEPAARIVELAEQEKADVIIMPTHGYGPFRRFILGSNTAKVLHDADCPVWTGVHLAQAPCETPEVHTVLCAVDLGPQSSKALCWAALFAQEYGARLVLAHAMPPVPDAGEKPEASWAAGVRDAAERELRRLRDFVHAGADLTVEIGEPASAICSLAERIHADALVIGRGSAAGVFGRLRTNAYAIIRQSPCPVVSV
jgi:nucleotide-binding universal stress UspA family protein